LAGCKFGRGQAGRSRQPAHHTGEKIARSILADHVARGVPDQSHREPHRRPQASGPSMTGTLGGVLSLQAPDIQTYQVRSLTPGGKNAGWIRKVRLQTCRPLNGRITGPDGW
jgi:hypothetical protein